jgi:hypothetical protein
VTRTTRVQPLPGSAGRYERFLSPAHLLIAAGVIVTAVVVFVLVTLATRERYVPTFTDGPRAQISQTSFDYGDVKNNTTVKTTFTIQNVGNKQLYFPMEPQVTVVEGCCPPTTQIDRSELDPGETATVSLSFSMHEGMDGPHDFRVKVITNDALEPEQEVAVLSNWVP